ncbi:phosphoethanolamine transferase [Herminiimonas sp. NPDC097707]|uniref:phosphoethanolamine transferase n=1 Tax=Herminiimonas sp. NPDC097707 TaxID=3364007 RepID=UPI00383BF2ED
MSQAAGNTGAVSRSLLSVFARLPAIGVERLGILASLFFSIACNYLFFSAALANRDWSHPASWLFAGAIFIAITALQSAGLFVVLNRWSAKPVLTVLFIVTAAATYYMNKYTVFFNTEMVRNILRTDVKEASELFSLNFCIHMFMYAALPILLVWKLRLKTIPLRRAIPVRLAYIVGAIVIAAGSILLVFQDFSSLMRNQKEVRFLIMPSNYLFSLTRVVAADTAQANVPKISISDDAKLGAAWGQRAKPMLFVLVVGETTRAANWGLNGYARQTTPELSKLDVVNFPHASSCGTNTEVSVPCMFSTYGRRNYDETKIRAHESLLHIIDHAGLKTIWRDNQAGCKGVCDGLEEQRLDSSKNAALCDGERCFDEILLDNMDGEIHKAQNGNLFVVLHMLGNHGPSYFRRYPAAMRSFTPTCDTSDLSKCSQQEIVNAYDNGVLYTDHFLAKTISYLKTQTTYDTAMLYLSDHGESLGEHGIYLHGLPYSIAPKEQTEIPMVMWLSQGFASSFGVDKDCLSKRSRNPVSQDNLFHSILGMLQIESKHYDKSMDLSAGCRA